MSQENAILLNMNNQTKQKPLTAAKKKQLAKAVKKTVKQYGKTLQLLAKS